MPKSLFKNFLCFSDYSANQIICDREEKTGEMPWFECSLVLQTHTRPGGGNADVFFILTQFSVSFVQTYLRRDTLCFSSIFSRLSLSLHSPLFIIWRDECLGKAANKALNATGQGRFTVLNSECTPSTITGT